MERRNFSLKTYFKRFGPIQMEEKDKVSQMDHALLAKIRGPLGESKFPLIGAVVFGSRVKGKATTSSDIDLMIVGEKINAKRHRRGEEIAQIKKGLPGLPLDILLLTRQEVESNFRNHNPLFLDIAEEGVILMDDHQWLENLAEKTREYIKRKGIRRTDQGWIFPVIRGVPTYLSKVSNKDFSLAMIKDGERDYKIGLDLTSAVYYDKAVYHFQQSVEKSLKSVLIAMGIFQRTHFVGEALRERLLEKVVPVEWRDEFVKLAEISEGIEPEMNLSRYPGIIDDHLWLPYEEYEQVDAERAKEKAVYVLTAAKRFLGEWFPENKGGRSSKE